MGATIFGFLTESFFFDRALIADKFRTIDEKRLRAELRAYRDFCLSSKAEIESEVSANKSSLKVLSGVECPDVRLLKQSAFYIEQYILPDPLFAMTHESGQMNDAISSYLGMGQSVIDRDRLATILSYLHSLTPMVAANYVKFLPLSYIFEPPKNTPIYASDNYFADILPKEILEYFHDKAIVESLRKTDQGWIIENKLTLGRGISIRFKGHDENSCRIYHLFEHDVRELKEEDRTVHGILYLPDTPPTIPHFQAWVFQSINRSSRDFYDRIFTEVAIGAKMNAAYLSDSPFVYELLNKTLPLKSDLKTHTANTLLKFELPFLDRVSVDTLMNVRQNDGEAFGNYRIELDKLFRDLRLEHDQDTVKLKAENAMHEMEEVQLYKLKCKLTEIKRGLFAEAALLTAGLLGSVQTSGWSLVASAVAVAKGFKTVNEYWSNVRSNPSFFLWKVLKDSE